MCNQRGVGLSSDTQGGLAVRRTRPHSAPDAGQCAGRSSPSAPRRSKFQAKVTPRAVAALSAARPAPLPPHPRRAYSPTRLGLNPLLTPALHSRATAHSRATGVLSLHPVRHPQAAALSALTAPSAATPPHLSARAHARCHSHPRRSWREGGGGGDGGWEVGPRRGYVGAEAW